MLKFFKNRRPETFLLLMVYSFLLNGILYFKSGEAGGNIHSFAFDQLDIDFSFLPRTLLVTISILTLFIQALFVNNIVSKFRINRHPSLLPAFMYVTLVSIFSEVILLNPSFLTMFLILLVIQNLLATFDMENSLQKMFFISFYIGLGSLVYSPMIFYILVVIVSFPILKRPKLSEFVIIPVGFMIPFYLTGLAFYMVDQLPFFLSALQNSFPDIGYLDEVVSINHMIPISYVLLLVIIGFFQNQFYMPNKTVRQVRYQSVFVIYFVVTFLLIFLTSVNKMQIGYYFSIPVAVFLSILFSEGRQKLYDAMYLTLIILIAISQYLNF